MKIDSVFDIYQNSFLGALLLSEFIVSYEKNNKDNQSPTMDRILPVLPILFTKDIINSAKGRSNKIKGFYNLLEDNRLLFEIIPDKTERMFDKTMSSLLICNKADLLDINFKTNTVSTKLDTTKQKFKSSSLEVGELVKVSRKLGGWFANLSDIEFLIYLDL